MGPADKIPVSVCIMAQNEAGRIEECLRSADFAAERLVLDGGSTDSTAEIARALGARVESRAFDGMVSQSQALVAMAANEWVLVLDADERVSSALQTEICSLFRSGPPQACGFEIPRRAWHLGRWVRGGGWHPDLKLRLFDRRRAKMAGSEPHYKVFPDGAVGRLHGEICHFPYRDLEHHFERMDRYSSAAARTERTRRKRFPLLQMIFKPPARFLKFYLLRAGFRDGAAGLVLAGMAGFYEFQRYAKVWDLRRQERRARNRPPCP